jgi:hypothetical protein
MAAVPFCSIDPRGHAATARQWHSRWDTGWHQGQDSPDQTLNAGVTDMLFAKINAPLFARTKQSWLDCALIEHLTPNFMLEHT